MSKMVSRWTQGARLQNHEIKGYLFEDGSIHYNFERNGCPLGTVSVKERDKIIKDFGMSVVFNDEEREKEDLELIGFLA